MRFRPRTRPPAGRPTPNRVGRLLHRLQEDILVQWQLDLKEAGGVLGPELRRYRSAYERDFQRDWRESTPAELLRSVAEADIVYCGDHHYLAPAQRLLLRLLRRMEPANSADTLALEMLHTRDQPLVDAFLAGRIEPPLLRDAILYDTRWPFDWDAYFPLLEFARRQRLAVLAINTEPAHPRANPLARRDAHAAARLVDRLAERRGGRIFVLAGDWHLAARHLPARVDELARRRGLTMRRVVIHQNHDGLYRRLMSRFGHVPAVVSGGADVFCVLNSTPLVKARAQLAWLGRSHGDAVQSPDSAAAFQDIARALVHHLDLDPTPLEVVTPWVIEDERDLAATGRLLGWSPVNRARTWQRLRRGEVLHFRRKRLLLLNHPPLNRLAEAAAALLGAPTTAVRRQLGRNRWAACAVRAGALFFATRLINPRRKCSLLGDLSALRRADGVAGTAGAWAERLIRSRGTPPPGSQFWRRPTRTLAAAARRVGAAWGYALYDDYVAGSLPADFVRRLFSRAADSTEAVALLDGGLRGTRATSGTLSQRELL